MSDFELVPKTPMEPHGDFSKLHLIVPISNPVGYKSRYKNYKLFEESALRKGIHVWTIEMQTGARSAAVTHMDNCHHVTIYQTGLEGELWHKEQLINICAQNIVHLYPECRYIMYSDADLLYEADAFEKILQALQIWPIVQCWSHLVSLDDQGHVLNVFKSFMYCKYNPKDTASHPGYPPRVGSPGGAWAFRREILNQLGTALSGPILDFTIAGSGDLYFARSVMGEAHMCANKKFHPNYNKWILKYGDHCDWIVQRNVGYVSNTVRHLFHGKHEQRGYDWRNNILKDHQFDPEEDLTKDVSGLWRLVVRTHRQMSMRDALRRYFRSRNEDVKV